MILNGEGSVPAVHLNWISKWSGNQQENNVDVATFFRCFNCFSLGNLNYKTSKWIDAESRSG